MTTEPLRHIRPGHVREHARPRDGAEGGEETAGGRLPRSEGRRRGMRRERPVSRPSRPRRGSQRAPSPAQVRRGRFKNLWSRFTFNCKFSIASRVRIFSWSSASLAMDPRPRRAAGAGGCAPSAGRPSTACCRCRGPTPTPRAGSRRAPRRAPPPPAFGPPCFLFALRSRPSRALPRRPRPAPARLQARRLSRSRGAQAGTGRVPGPRQPIDASSFQQERNSP